MSPSHVSYREHADQWPEWSTSAGVDRIVASARGLKVRFPRRLAHRLLLLLGLSLIAACSQDAAQHRFDDYQARLARSLKLDAVESSSVQTPIRRPRKRDLLVQAPEVKISMIEFLRLYDCAVHEVIGERNSVLGKVAPASQRLFTDLAFLQLAPDCVTQLRAESHDELADTVDAAIAAKRDGLPIAVYNATLASEEFAGFWQLPMALADFPDDAGNALVDDMTYIESQVSRWLSGDYEHDASRFEKALGSVRHGKAGYLLTAAVLTHSRLASANALVQARQQGRPLCFNGNPSQQGRILRRVVDEFLIADIQVWLSRVSALRYELLAPHATLEEHLASTLPPSYRAWQQGRDKQLAWLASAPRNHVQAVRPILASCGLAPGG